MIGVVVITLTGTISKEDDEYVSICNELGISTTGATSDEVWRRTDDMIKSYFAACQQLGTLADEIQRLLSAGVARHLDDIEAVASTPGAAVPQHNELKIRRSWKHDDVQQMAL